MSGARTHWIARNETRGTVIAEQVAIADSMLRRLRGLLGTRALPSRHGLLLRPCRQVHSFFMRYAIDLVFLDAADHVLRTVPRFPVNRMSPLVRAAASVLELPAGTLDATPAAPGDALRLEPQPT
jgi:uncharacterized membrane protein (UPF0127 family)